LFHDFEFARVKNFVEKKSPRLRLRPGVILKKSFKNEVLAVASRRKGVTTGRKAVATGRMPVAGRQTSGIMHFTSVTAKTL
jgi:hypothetical protein